MYPNIGQKTVWDGGHAYAHKIPLPVVGGPSSPQTVFADPTAEFAPLPAEIPDDPFKLSMIVLQPTPFCNLECDYCYLADKRSSAEMPVAVAERVAEFVGQQDNTDLMVAWHGGEPLAVGLSRFRDLVSPFESQENRATQTLQTNATLIDDSWCEFFLEHRIRVGVSIDGPERMTSKRKHRSGRAAFTDIMRGIEALREAEVSFGVIAVVSEENLCRARELYAFVRSIGARNLAVNMEEVDGVNMTGVRARPEVRQFWVDLYAAWQDDPNLSIREFDKAFEMLRYVVHQSRANLEINTIRLNLLPSIAVSGDVALLSPELVNGTATAKNLFILGNVLEEPLEEILENGRQASYVRAFLWGVSHCRRTCSYFPVCRGGFASNKFYENGALDTTATEQCRTNTMALYDALLEESVDDRRAVVISAKEK